jgi:hypothetical protein
MSSFSNPPSLQLPSVAFFGRTFDEYSHCLGFDGSALRGRRVLDVAAGPSSFTVEARTRGADSIAVDPLYGCTHEALTAHVLLDYDRMFREMRRVESLLTYQYFPSFAAAEASRRAAATRFLADYEDGFVQGRYVGGALPRLPFPDGAFDLTLCAHFLFLYAARFDYAFHLAACRELVRVTAGEVRIHPVCGLGGQPYPELARLQADLRETGIASRVIPVDFKFFTGTDTTLVLTS